MPDYGDSQIAVIDARILAYAKTLQKMGTVTERSTTGTGAKVVFDGSSGTAQPVKCFESVVIAEGDRVGLVKYESEWIVTANYSGTHLADESTAFTFASLSSSSSATYVDMPSSPGLIYTKRRDLTVMEYWGGVSTRNSVSATQQRLGFRITGVDGVIDYDQDIRSYAVNAINAHTYWSGTVRLSAQHPAGVYSVTARWMRISGTDSMSVDALDTVQMHCREVWP